MNCNKITKYLNRLLMSEAIQNVTKPSSIECKSLQNVKNRRATFLWKISLFCEFCGMNIESKIEAGCFVAECFHWIDDSEETNDTTK